MKKHYLVLSLLIGVLFFTACQKELSLEVNNNDSSGSLQSDIAGECLPKTVQGVYEEGTVLDPATNYIDVQVNTTAIGSYRIYSDTLNGIFFEAKGAFASAGLNTIRLAGTGTPSAAGVQNFTITYDSTECTVVISTLPQGGASEAEFTFAGAPDACMNYALTGDYIVNVPMTSSNTVVINVDVTVPGIYTLTTQTSNGIFFSGTGSFTNTGTQTITLTAEGNPIVAGSTNIPVIADPSNSTCSFVVDVTGAAAFTIDCTSAFVDGTYEEGVALDATNTVDINVNVTTLGAYSITTTAVNGMVFSGSGNLTAAGGPQTITLTGSGTPVAEETSAINIPGSSSCTFEVIVDPGIPATDLKWQFTQGGVTYEGPTNGAITLPLSGMESTGIGGETTAGDISFGLTLTKNGTMQAGTFSTGAILPNNIATLLMANNTTGDPVFTGIFGAGTLTVNLTTYDETTKIAEGTFSGTVINGANAVVSITNGTFKAEIL